jgi:TPR repeat protein
VEGSATGDSNLPTVRVPAELQADENRKEDEAGVANAESSGDDGLELSAKKKRDYSSKMEGGGTEQQPPSISRERDPKGDAKTGGGAKVRRNHGKDRGSSSEKGGKVEEDSSTECQGLQRTYGVRPCISWGEAARRSDIQERWTQLDCDKQLGVVCQVAGADDPAPDTLPGSEDFEQGRRHLMTARGWEGVGGSSDFHSMAEAQTAARRLLEQADGAGHGGATYLLGEMAEFGEGQPDRGDEPDEAATAELYARAAARKSPEARYAVADRLAATLSYRWICAQCAVREGAVGAGDDSDGDDPAGHAGVQEALMNAARRGSTLALLALSAKDYEAALGSGPKAEAQCEAAFQYLRPAADLAVKAIQDSGGGAAETEQVAARSATRRNL